MFALGTLIGIFGYSIFLLGLLGLLSKQYISFLTAGVLFTSIYYFLKNSSLKLKLLGLRKKNLLFYLLTVILLLQTFINFIGVMGPELAFDAIWYHLTLPKLYLINQSIFHIPGGLLYYSDMPKLAEMLYTVGLAMGDEKLSKLIHFGFGILTCIAVYKISRKYLNIFLSTLGVLVFYSSLIVGWQSITAYVDLSRSFFEIMALWGFLNFTETRERKWLIESAVMLGLAISTKLIALGSIIIFIVLLFSFLYRNKFSHGKVVSRVLLFTFISLLIPSPWLVFSWINTGNIAYPLLTNVYPVNLQFMNLLNPINMVRDLFTLFLRSDVPISPIYLVFFPIVLYYFRNLSLSGKVISAYSLLAILVWYVTPRTGGGRFILPYLPAFSILVALALSKVKNKLIHNYLVFLIILISVTSIGYRAVANFKYVPVVFGQQSKSEFLKNNLNFSYGDFYDTDDYFKNNIKKTDKVLLYGFHNLYYVNFPFIDSSWVKKGDELNYIAVQNSKIPDKFSDWNMIYYNSDTKVKLYTKGGIRWVY